KLYRTGDLGRWLPNGAIEYLGRNDHQIKLRGFRVELGEIEAQLLRHEQIKDAVVIAREDVPGEKRLVAYLLYRDGARPKVEELPGHLESTLPEHMVPSAFVVLDCFPLSPNGKLERRALPPPGAAAYVQRPYEAPRGPMENLLVTLWQDLLPVPR